MQEEKIINTDPQTNPENMDSIQVKPGWNTSQGQMTAFIMMLSTMMAAYLGWTWVTPELLNNLYQLITVVLVILGLLGINVPILTNYINSRGKIQSNAIWATTALNAGNFGDFFKSKIWKDPSTYIELGKVASNVIPGGAAVGGILEKVSPSNQNDEIIEYLKKLDARLELVEREMNKRM